ncbi:hypothetical protein ACIBSV_07975 [Embleya sp. NPDC050154]|uniref:hypothetical protein n=1 Tax=Embleya sp. NPDC050154 TaxID=3363988 RepID=UPI0037AB5F6C
MAPAAYARGPDAPRVDIIFGGSTDRADHIRDGRADVVAWAQDDRRSLVASFVAAAAEAAGIEDAPTTRMRSRPPDH